MMEEKNHSVVESIKNRETEIVRSSVDPKCDSSNELPVELPVEQTMNCSPTASSCDLSSVHEFNNNTCTSSSHPTSSSSSSSSHPTSSSSADIIDVHRGTPIRLKVKVLVPVDDHPNVSSNFSLIFFFLSFFFSIIRFSFHLFLFLPHSRMG